MSSQQSVQNLQGQIHKAGCSSMVVPPHPTPNTRTDGSITQGHEKKCLEKVRQVKLGTTCRVSGWKWLRNDRDRKLPTISPIYGT